VVTNKQMCVWVVDTSHDPVGDLPITPTLTCIHTQARALPGPLIAPPVPAWALLVYLPFQKFHYTPLPLPAGAYIPLLPHVLGRREAWRHQTRYERRHISLNADRHYGFAQRACCAFLARHSAAGGIRQTRISSRCQQQLYTRGHRLGRGLSVWNGLPRAPRSCHLSRRAQGIKHAPRHFSRTAPRSAPCLSPLRAHRLAIAAGLRISSRVSAPAAA